ncbi:MAG: hypothetical protein WDO56_00810 [Gammaproteobacteria bacterium]
MTLIRAVGSHDSAGEPVRLDLPQNPDNPVAATGEDANGVIVVVQNRARAVE